ncbi:MAG: ATP synthase F1 subunit delta [Prevotellaceae bacterium]|jgi:F-type H+-transporting ATPase subunit delta|nr:ATP synthase F1 subunit delta [Prevotellaceae bacterium]
MNAGIISNRYARALYSFAEDAGTTSRVYDEMLCLSEMFFDNPELKNFLDNPVATPEDKTRLLLIAAGGEANISPTTAHFVRFVIEKRKENKMHAIALTYNDLYREAKVIVSAQIISAKPLSAENREKIVQLIERKYLSANSTLQLDVKTNTELIGGFVLRVGNDKLDASVSGELKEIKRKVA